MKNLYLYLAGMVMLASGYFIVDTKDSVFQDIIYKNEAALKESGKKSSFSKQLQKSPLTATKNKSASVVAASITATNSYTITNDLGAPGATAGDEITYTVTIANGGTDASGIVYNSTIDPNTTLVPGSVKVSPIVQNDSYSTIGNVTLNIPAEGGLFANDISPDGSAWTLTSASSIGTAHGGIATITASTGAFTYVPAPGYTGDDTFNYTVQNASGAGFTALVTITLTNKIWFINSAASGTSVGTLANPFTSIASFQSANTGATGKPGTGDYIFIYSGNYSGSMTLLSGQKLIGQGASNTIQQITTFASPSGVNLLPPTGTAPVLTTAGTGVDAIILNQNNTIRGFSIENTSGKKIKGASFGTLTASEVSLTGTGAALDLNNGILNAAFPTLSSASTGTAGISVTAVSGTLSNSAGTISSTNATAVQISGTGTLTLGLTFASISSSGATKGISLSNTSGTFKVNGTGTTAGSGGVISNISQRGAEFISASGVTLQNMNFTTANTTDGSSDVDNTNSNAAIYARSLGGITLTNLSINGASQYGLSFINVSNFALSNTSVSNAGTSEDEGGIYATNSTGTSTITGLTISNSSGRGAYFRNSGSSALTKLTIGSTTISDLPNAEALLLESWNTSNMNVIVKENSQFLRSQSTAVAVYANDASIINADLLNNTIDPGTGNGAGLDISSSGTATINFNVLDNIVKARTSTVINNFAYDGSTLQGTIQNNTATSLGGDGAGIVVRTETPGGRSATGTVKIDNNTISGVTQDNAIRVSAFSFNNTPINATITNNIINSNISNGYLYSQIDLSLNSIAGNNAVLCANILSNHLEGGSSQFGLLNVNVRTGTVIKFPQAGALVDIWNTNQNKPTGTTSGNTKVSINNAGTQLTGTCPVPTNPKQRIAADETIAATDAVKPEPVSTEKIKPETVKEENNKIGNSEENSLRIEAPLAVGTVNVGGTNGFPIPAEKSVTITYKVTVNSVIPANVCKISNQGTVSGTGITPVLTDDISVGGASDPTTTAVTPTALPTITQGPVNSAVCAGSTATFSVTVTETGLSYQWQKKISGGTFTNIDPASNASAATATLSLSNVPTTDNAAQYQVIVFSPCVTTTSGFATLTVNKIETASITGSTSTDQNSTMPTITFAATGGTKPYTFAYTLNGDAKTVSTVGNASTAVASQPTTQAGSFVYELKSVTDATSCGYTPATTQSVTINVTPLPVTLTVFTAAKEGNSAMLNWETTMETNSDRFEIERSQDGKSWLNIGTKYANGESSTTIKYSFSDANPTAGENLYRLKMIDKDQTFAYSRIRSLTFSIDLQASFYPNPVSDQLHLNVADWNKVAAVELISVKGQSIYKSEKTLSTVIDVSRFPAGIYIVSLRYVDGSNKSYKVVVSH
ncbi:Ig-like domain-containing protein [Dyadobacter subterraneus]|uniref:T9SS type A sorting domain-containing protein n=1 Tax=Dyadobacter subterraneus TaxID=2773304 RepID=A0ABR9W8Q4_9BACT|nr:Ig-like domain-containing protein [Dyadobacter subterraneus]MBE9461793.1 T9SS type A sorting domain-containing protein [Dyadobacter subterraneus]